MSMKNMNNKKVFSRLDIDVYPVDNKDKPNYTGREIILAGAVLFLTGTLLGMIFSPRKYQVIGSHNRNGSGNGNDAKAEPKKDTHH